MCVLCKESFWPVCIYVMKAEERQMQSQCLTLSKIIACHVLLIGLENFEEENGKLVGCASEGRKGATTME